MAESHREHKLLLQPTSILPKTSRLLKTREFKSVLDKGSKVVLPEMVVFALPREGPSRLGLIVSKKVGKAVTRNLVKRRLREAFRHSRDDKQWDIVVIARRAAVQADAHHIVNAWELSLRRLCRTMPVSWKPQTNESKC